jgi:hypothetical protein
MTENEHKQIGEMASILFELCHEKTDCSPIADCEICRADRLYYKGYRKVERGEWEDKRCTKCGENMWYIARGNALATTFYQVKSKFCPNCGADIRGRENER